MACWGNNDYGQLGQGGPRPELAPVALTNLAGLSSQILDLDMGISHTCALLSDGEVRCFGSNEYRQLGDGSFDDSKAPVMVSGIDQQAVALSVGGHQACALLESGAVKCWGSKMYDDRGMMGPVVYSDVAALVPGLVSGATAIAVGQNHACALRQKQVVCWGNNSRGQLAGTQVTDSDQPLPINALGKRVTQLSAGANYTCALTSAPARVYCWGDDSHGQLGGSMNSGSLEPVPLPYDASDPVVAISTGSTHACARLQTGKAWCWGSNRNAELGDGQINEAKAHAPVKVDVDARVLDVQAGQGYTCLRVEPEDRDSSRSNTTNPELRCWGWNMYGQLGRGQKDAWGDLTKPAPVALFP